MWVRVHTGLCGASPARVFGILADVHRWSEWNAGVARVDIRGPFAEGTTAVMTLPDQTALPFRLSWVDPDRGFEDETPIPEMNVMVRVRHELTPTEGGTRITYRCHVDGPDDLAAEIGSAVTADFPEVIAALGRRAEAAR